MTVNRFATSIDPVHCLVGVGSSATCLRVSPLVSAIRTASVRNSSVRFSPIVHLLCCSKCYQRSGIKPRQVQNEVWLQLHAPAYNLGVFLQGADLPEEMTDWSLTSLQTRLIKIGARVVDMPAPLPSNSLRFLSVAIYLLASLQQSIGCAHRRFPYEDIMAIIERKRLEWSAQGLARSPVWMLQSDDRPNRAALNSLQDKDGQRNRCHSALGHYLAEKSYDLENTRYRETQQCGNR